MKDTTDQVTGGEFTAQDYKEGVAIELRNLLLASGVNPDELVQDQLQTAIDVRIDVKLSQLQAALAFNGTPTPGASLVGYHDAHDTPSGTTVQDKINQLDTGGSLALLNVFYPVGCVFLAGSLVKPPGHSLSAHPIAGVIWEEPTASQGHLLVGSKQTGAWAVNEGSTAGTSQITNPMTAANLIEHTHRLLPSDDAVMLHGSGGQEYKFENNRSNTTNITSTQPAGQANPTGIGLSNLQRYGVLIWKRTA